MGYRVCGCPTVSYVPSLSMSETEDVGLAQSEAGMGLTQGEAGFSMREDFENEGPPVQRFRPGGPKEARLNRVRLMETGRYYEAAIARGEHPEDPDAFFSLKVENLPLMTTEDQLRREFEVFGKIGDVYRPIDKDTKRPVRFVFIRFVYKGDMLRAMEELQGKSINGRNMKI